MNIAERANLYRLSALRQLWSQSDGVSMPGSGRFASQVFHESVDGLEEVVTLSPTTGVLNAGLSGCPQRAGRNEDVLGFPDELSAGPIASDEVSIRAEWWDSIASWPGQHSIAAFWRDGAAGPPLVVGFGRCEARDQCLYFALCDRFPDRIAAIGDVSTISVRYEWTDGTFVDILSPQNVHGVPGEVLAALLALAARPDPVEVAANAQRWRELKAENAPFRVVSEGGLADRSDHSARASMPDWSAIGLRALGWAGRPTARAAYAGRKWR